MSAFDTRPVRLGLPLWGQPAWKGSLYPEHASPRDFLEHYARVMDAVEGNTTFYSVPPVAAVARWVAQTPAEFRFSFKFPRVITHDRALRGAEQETTEFLLRLEPLGPRLGSYLLQFSRHFAPGDLPVLGRYLQRLPKDYRYAVEVRHPDFFSREGSERLDTLLFAHGVERVVMDTRGMRAGDPDHPDVRAAAHEKPDTPVAIRTLTQAPVIRFVAHPTRSVNAPFLARWAEVLSDWVNAGRRPVFFMHCPNNAHSPELALWLDRLVRTRLDMPALPLVEAAAANGAALDTAQLSLI
ncbi:MAG: DUF72 domain-containing protein [Pseudomonadales bacterium]|nr:DUF72 domain-containing protein [Pseudomonadales bacterium]